MSTPKPKLYRARCAKCGRRFPTSTLDHAAISKGLKSRLLCWDCVPARFAAMKGLR